MNRSELKALIREVVEEAERQSGREYLHLLPNNNFRIIESPSSEMNKLVDDVENGRFVGVLYKRIMPDK